MSDPLQRAEEDMKQLMTFFAHLNEDAAEIVLLGLVMNVFFCSFFFIFYPLLRKMKKTANKTTKGTEK